MVQHSRPDVKCRLASLIDVFPKGRENVDLVHRDPDWANLVLTPEKHILCSFLAGPGRVTGVFCVVPAWGWGDRPGFDIEFL